LDNLTSDRVAQPEPQPEIPSRFPVPVTILAGFLGSGKTTLLNRILHADHGLRVAVLVNDFGEINIDSQMIVDVQGDTISLANGCICCTIRSDLLDAVLRLVEGDDPPEYIVIETSGVSDPLEVALTFNAPNIQHLVRVDSILTLIDAEQIRSLDREYEVLAITQIGVADIVIINKTDLVTDEDLESLRKWIREIVKDARILETSYGDVPLELVMGAGRYSVERFADRTPADVHVHSGGAVGEHDHVHHDHSLIFDTWSWTSAEPLSLKSLRRAIKNLPPTIYRAKGILYLADAPDKRGVLQVTGRRASLTVEEPWGELPPHSQLVVIGSQGGVVPDQLEAQFEDSLAINEKSELERITGTVLGWLRGKS
jgi:G3E family GTPase